MEEFELIAKTFMGLEQVLAQELTQLGANNVQIGRRMVSFTGDKELMYRANFQLHTAIRVLKPIAHFKAKSAEDMYDEVKKIDWSKYILKGKTFSVDSVVYSEEFKNSRFVTYKVKDAIVDQFRELTGERPNISVSNPDIRLNIHIAEDKATLSLDSSGESLHRRGYRQESVEAPLNEVLAAGMILMTGWKERPISSTRCAVREHFLSRQLSSHATSHPVCSARNMPSRSGPTSIRSFSTPSTTTIRPSVSSLTTSMATTSI